MWVRRRFGDGRRMFILGLDAGFGGRGHVQFRLGFLCVLVLDTVWVLPTIWVSSIWGEHLIAVNAQQRD